MSYEGTRITSPNAGDTDIQQVAAAPSEFAACGDASHRPSARDWTEYSSRLGKQIGSDGLSIGLALNRPFEIECVLPRVTIALKTGSTKGVKAWNGDKTSPINVAPGSALVFPAGSHVFADVVKTSCFPVLEVPRTNIDQLSDDLGRTAPSTFDHIYDGLQSPIFLSLAHSIQHSLFRGSVAGKLAVDAMCVLVMTEVFQATSDWDAKASIRGLDPRRVSIAVDYIDEHLADDLSTQELASLTGLSVFHFTRAFKEATGFSPHQFVLEKRLEQACRELENSSAKIAEIAFDVGFSSQSHMTDVFRKRLGVTPRHYRKQLMS